MDPEADFGQESISSKEETSPSLEEETQDKVRPEKKRRIYKGKEKRPKKPRISLLQMTTKPSSKQDSRSQVVAETNEPPIKKTAKDGEA